VFLCLWTTKEQNKHSVSTTLRPTRLIFFPFRCLNYLKRVMAPAEHSLSVSNVALCEFNCSTNCGAPLLLIVEQPQRNFEALCSRLGYISFFPFSIMSCRVLVFRVRTKKHRQTFRQKPPSAEEPLTIEISLSIELPYTFGCTTWHRSTLRWARTNSWTNLTTYCLRPRVCPWGRRRNENNKTATSQLSGIQEERKRKLNNELFLLSTFLRLSLTFSQ
jgi:hypothetical protein